MELDYEQYKLVKEALHERRIFLQTAPYLSAMLPIMLPIYKCVYHHLYYFWLTNQNDSSGIGKFPTTGQVARCTTYWLERRTWSRHT